MRRTTVGSAVALVVALMLADLSRAEVLGTDAAPVDETEAAALELADPRILHASHFLGAPDDWPKAIAIYRDVLAEEPGHLQARMWLARALSWKGSHEEALSHYDIMLARDPTPDWVRVERAEVLSWAGRYQDAEAEFEDLLREEPRNARAARGLAHVYKWSERSGLALEAYENALAIEDDAEIRRERDELAGSLGRAGESDTSFFSDSDDFEKTELNVAGSVDLDFETRLLVSSGFTRIDGRAVDPDTRERDEAFDALVGVERRFGPRIRASVSAGARRWSHADDRFLARGEVEYSPLESTALGFQLDHGDYLARSNSLEAVDRGLLQTTTRLWIWQGVTDRISAYGAIEGTFVSDSNNRISLDASTSYAPWRHRDLRIGVGLAYLTFTGNSDDYYDPSMELDGSLFVQGSTPLYRDLVFELDARAGYGRSQDDGRAGSGLTYSITGGPKWSYEGWWVAIRGGRSQTQRVTTYTSHGVGLNVGVGF